MTGRGTLGTVAAARPCAVLIGPAGAGKSSVGRALAALLGVGHRDTDEDVEAGQGRSVAEIFSTEGEHRFRELEAASVAAGLGAHPGVLSLGGGAVTHRATRELLGGHAVVFLDVSCAEALRRIAGDAPRPLLAGAEPEERWTRLMGARRPLYLRCARAVVDTGGRSSDQVARQVLLALNAMRTAP